MKNWLIEQPRGVLHEPSRLRSFLSFPSVTVEANPSPTVVPDELEAAEQDMQEDEVEIFEIEPAAVEKPAELGPASKQITVSVRSEVTVSYETADPSLEARGLIKMLLGVQP